MTSKFGSAKEIGIFPREEAEKVKWENYNDMVTVNESQYSFGGEDIQQKFFESLVRSKNDKERYKFYRSEWYRRAKEFDPTEAPLAVCCELVSTCNLGCSMCYTITDEFQNSVVGATRMLPWNVVKKVIDECAEIGVYSMLFSWRGESTLYRVRDENNEIKTFGDVIKYANSKNILETSTLTHGQLIDEKLAKILVESNLSWINYSIDGLEKEYNKIRTPRNKKDDPSFNAFAVVTESLKTLTRVKKELNSKTPQLRTNSIFPSIYKNVKEFADHMYANGVDWVTINEILDFRFEEVPKEEVKDYWACSYPFQRLTVSANGTILPCTGAHNEEEGLVLGRYIGTPKKTVIRNDKKIDLEYKEMTLKEAWNCEKLKNIRFLHSNNRRCEINPGCQNCRHGMKKKGVTYVPEDWNVETMKWENHTWRNG
jgi:MoaA/NifB/PqqE/SkfB family radical SAM enzyme